MNSFRNILLLGSGSFCIIVLAYVTYSSPAYNIAAVIGSTGSKQAQQCIDTLHKTNNNAFEVYDVVPSLLNNDSRQDYILKTSSVQNCGSAGCVHELCIAHTDSIEIIPFGYAAESITVKNTSTNGMRDLHLQGKSASSLQWNGQRYILN